MLSTESVEREQEELTRFDALEVMNDDYLESTIIGNKRLTAIRERVASIYSKDHANITEADLKELEDIFGKVYTMEGKRRLVLYHDEKAEFQPKILKLDAKELNQILAKHRSPLPTVKQWFRVFEETESKVETVNQVQASEVGSEGKRKKGDDLSKADRHTALNSKHAGSKRKERSRSRSRSGERDERSKRHRHDDGHVDGEDALGNGGVDESRDESKAQKAGQNASRRSSRSPNKGDGSGKINQSQASQRKRSRSRSRSRGRGRGDGRHSGRRRASPSRDHKHTEFRRPRSRSPRNKSRSHSRSQRHSKPHNVSERRRNGSSAGRERNTSDEVAREGGRGEERAQSRSPSNNLDGDLRKDIENLTKMVTKLSSDQATMVADICSKVKATTDKQIGGFEIIYSDAILKKFKNVEYIALEEIFKLMARGVKTIKTKDVSLTDGVKLTLSDDVVTAGGMSLWDIFRSLFELIYGYIHVGKNVDARLAENMWQYYRNLWAIAGRYTTQSIKEVDEYARGKEEAQGPNAQWTLDMHAHFRILQPKTPRTSVNLKGGEDKPQTETD